MKSLQLLSIVTVFGTFQNTSENQNKIFGQEL
jgi:hypothetical protein